jgi:hypothetical protein
MLVVQLGVPLVEILSTSYPALKLSWLRGEARGKCGGGHKSVAFFYSSAPPQRLRESSLEVFAELRTYLVISIMVCSI